MTRQQLVKQNKCCFYAAICLQNSTSVKLRVSLGDNVIT